MKNVTSYIKLVCKGKNIKRNRKFDFPQTLNKQISKLDYKDIFRNMVEVYDLVDHSFHYNVVTLDDYLKEKTVYNLNKEKLNITVFYSNVMDKESYEQAEIYIAMMELEPSLIATDLLSGVVFKVENNKIKVIGKNHYIGKNNNVSGMLEFELFNKKHKVSHRITDNNEMTDKAMFETNHTDLEFGTVVGFTTEEINLMLEYIEQGDLQFAQETVDYICEDLISLDEREDRKFFNNIRLITLKDSQLNQDIYMFLSLYSLSTVSGKMDIRNKNQQIINGIMGHDQVRLQNYVEQHQAKLFLVNQNENPILIGGAEGTTILTDESIEPVYKGKIIFDYNDKKYCLEYNGNTIKLKGKPNDLAVVNFFNIKDDDFEVEAGDLCSSFENSGHLPVPFELTNNTGVFESDSEESKLLDTLYYNYYFDAEEQKLCNISLYRINFIDEDYLSEMELFLALFRDVEDCKSTNGVKPSDNDDENDNVIDMENDISINDVENDEYVYCVSRLIMKKDNKYFIIGRGAGDYGMSNQDFATDGDGIINTLECHYVVNDDSFILGIPRYKNKSIIGGQQYFGEIEILFDNPVPKNTRIRKNEE